MQGARKKSTSSWAAKLLAEVPWLGCSPKNRKRGKITRGDVRPLQAPRVFTGVVRTVGSPSGMQLMHAPVSPVVGQVHTKEKANPCCERLA